MQSLEKDLKAGMLESIIDPRRSAVEEPVSTWKDDGNAQGWDVEANGRCFHWVEQAMKYLKDFACKDAEFVKMVGCAVVLQRRDQRNGLRQSDWNHG